MKSVFFIKVHVQVFYIYKSDLNVKHRYYFFDKIHGLQKKNLDGKKQFFSVDYVKIFELHVIHT